MVAIDSSWSNSIDNNSNFDSKWLSEPYILMSALKAKFKDINIIVIRQERSSRTTECEKSLIPQKDHFIREVYIRDANTPLIYGRTIFSEQAYHNLKKDISSLNVSPIGETILYKSSYIRSDFSFSRLCDNSKLFTFATDNLDENFNPSFALARRSSFYLNSPLHHDILLTEVFFPWMGCYKGDEQ